jgi:hypothetical protein
VSESLGEVEVLIFKSCDGAVVALLNQYASMEGDDMAHRMCCYLDGASHHCLSECYSRSTIVSDVDDGGVVLNVDGRSVQELDYVEVRTTEQRDKHTRIGRRLSTRGCMRCRDSTKYAQERMFRDVAEALQSIQQGPSDTRS